MYERHGLIMPARSPQGWRLYGPRELARLNTIAFLKGLGLSLAQIRQALTGSALSLERGLQLRIASTSRPRAVSRESLQGSCSKGSLPHRARRSGY